MMTTAPACRSGGALDASSDRDEAVFVAVDPASSSLTDRAIAQAITHLRAKPQDDGARVTLAQAYLQKVREVGDPTFYGRADALLKDVAKRQKNNPDVLVTKGTLALALHDFKDALELGKRALKAAPGNTGAYGVLVDAQNELGDLDAALTSTQAMVDAKPNLPSLARVSYARELRGDLPGAIAAMTQAVAAGGSSGGENVAYAQAQLGGLLLTSGDLAGADRAFDAALVSFPLFTLAEAGKARVLVARDRPSEAADILGRVVERQPLAEHAIAQADALTAAGRMDEAQRAGELVDVIARLYRANGVNVDREIALFSADTRPSKESLSQARKALENRPSPASHDVLAWNLYKTGSIVKAARESDTALRFGSKDPQERYHAAAIALALDDREKAKGHLQVTLSTNPRFSAPRVADVSTLAAQLGLVMPPVPQ